MFKVCAAVVKGTLENGLERWGQLHMLFVMVIINETF
jgi:hypothetical protein